MNYGIRFSEIISVLGGCDGQADTPDPIPNSEVKRPGGENTLAGKIAAAAFLVLQILFTRRKQSKSFIKKL